MKHLLSDRAAKGLKPKDKPYKASDGQQAYISVATTGVKSYRFDYQLHGKRKTYTAGVYPQISLKYARKLADDARDLIRQGIDPNEQKKAARSKLAKGTPAPSLRKVAKQWIASERDWSDNHRKTLSQRFERDILRYLGDRRITDITPEMIDARLHDAAARVKVDTAHRVRGIVRQFYKTKLVASLVPDPKIMSEVGQDLPPLPPRRRRGHFPAITAPREFGGLLRKMDKYDGNEQIKAALLLSPLLFLRPTELRTLEWANVSLTDAMITVPAERMKNREELLVPLSRQAVDILTRLHKLTGTGGLLFPSVQCRFDVPAEHQKPISDGTINKCLRIVKVHADEHTAHGYRASARTLISERLGVPDSVIELQLAHVPQDSLHGAYSRSQRIEARIKMMQDWADLCDTLKADKEGAVVIPFRNAAI